MDSFYVSLGPSSLLSFEEQHFLSAGGGRGAHERQGLGIR